MYETITSNQNENFLNKNRKIIGLDLSNINKENDSKH